MSKNKYDKDSIKVLTDIEHIQTRPGMYIGELEDPRQLLSEALDNALDEIQSGYGNHVVIKVDTEKNVYEVIDFGRGIPEGKIDGIETVELLSTKAFSGTKFDNIIYRVSAGLNGVGLICINALSEDFLLTTRRKGKQVSYQSSKGKKLGIFKGKTVDDNGVTLKFKADPTVFNTTTIPIDYIKNRCNIATAFGFNVDLYIDGKKIDLDVTNIFSLIPFESGVNEFCRHGFSIETKSKEKVEVAFVYTSETNTKYYGYTNLLYNADGGNHIKLIENSLKDSWEKHLPKELNINDCLVGLRLVVAVFLSSPDFSSQTKNKLTVDKKHLESLFKDRLVKEFSKFINSNVKRKQGLIKRFSDFRDSQNKLLAKKQINKLVVFGDNDGDGKIRRKSIIPKLIECTSKFRDKTELIITEGDSAAGSAILCRDMKYQAILPIRGKILNVAKISKPQDCLQNEEVKNIVNSIGSGFLSSCDFSKARYDKVVLTCDADPDGKNIAVLLIALFVNLLPDLVKNDMVELVLPPLYGWENSGTFKFSDKLEDIPKKANFTRYKGLGEMDPQELFVSCINPLTRKTVLVVYPSDLKQFNKIMTSAKEKFTILEKMGVIVYS